MLLDLFLVRFSLVFLFVPCGGLSWLHISFLLHVKYTILYYVFYCMYVNIYHNITDRRICYDK